MSTAAKAKAEQAARVMADNFSDFAGEVVTATVATLADGVAVVFRFETEAGIDRALAAHALFGAPAPTERRPARAGLGPTIRWRFN